MILTSSSYRWLLFLAAISCWAQGTEGLISGHVTDNTTNQALADAEVSCLNSQTNSTWTVRTGTSGIYALPLLPPGTYRIEVGKAGYQSKQQFEIPLGVAASLDLDFALRPVEDIWESRLSRTVLLPAGGTILSLYGPDVDPNHWTTYSENAGKNGKLEASVSDAVRPDEIRQLPLNGQNIYTILLAEPGVAADNATTRSLGIAANGQRPSSSNFLLDGIETNFDLISGPLLSVAPEAVQEYRLSTNNFSAEYGRSAGYIANAVSRSGGDQWHGVGYFQLMNDVLNANDFQNNLSGLSRTPLKEDRAGGFAGGPVLKNRLFMGNSIEYFRSRSAEQPFTYDLPNTALVALACASPGTISCGLLRNFPLSNSTAFDPFLAQVTLAQPVAVNQWLGLERLDYVDPKGSQQIGLRFAGSNLSRPDFIWSPYADYDSALNQPVFSVAANWTRTIRPTLTNHLTIGWNYERLSFGRAQPEVPTLEVTGGNPGTNPLLPGSPAAYSFNNSNRSGELNDSVIVVRGRHIVRFGGGGFFRRTDDFLGYGLDGEYSFNNIIDFALDQPSKFTAALSRQTPNFVQPDLARQYRSRQFFGFAEDTFRITSRLVANFGLRYDDFGPPTSVGSAKDWMFEFGPGGSFEERIAGASLQPPSAGGSNVYTSNHQDFAPRIGFAYDVSKTGQVVLRGGFGVFYDRLFDNLWLNARNNSFVLPSLFDVKNSNYLAGAGAVLASYSGTNFVNSFTPNLTAFQHGLSNGYAEDFFIGVQSQPSPGWSFEVNGAASLGRKLITTDILNRNADVNPALPPINYLSSQGLSDYYSLNLVTRWRHKHGFLQAAYTWSHAIDLQSDPLSGDYFNLLFVNIGPAPATAVKAAFSNPYDSRGDRGNADFDQRHNLVFYSLWRTPVNGILRGFTFSQIAAIRSGFPYSIYTVPSSLDEINPRARVIGPGNGLLPSPVPVPGGEQMFDGSGFCPTSACGYGESGRNAFAGPGLINIDLAVSRAFRMVFLGEAGRVTLRGDFFNALNHANLNPPGNLPNTPGFGVALYGQPAAGAGFPALIPLAETARQVQLHVQISF